VTVLAGSDDRADPLRFPSAPAAARSFQAQPSRADADLSRRIAAQSVPGGAKADAVVASDGSGQYRTVQEAINAAPQDTSADHRWIIRIKPGTYHELVYVQREKRFVMLVGDDPTTTTITYDLKAGDTGPDGKPIGTFRTPTAVIDADDFSAENLTFENAAGPNGQALAVRVDGDRVVFRNCRFLGWQDTIFLDRGRQYFEDSLVTGHVDFIFGGATTWFERCRMHVWRSGYITAAATPREAAYGFVFAHGRITGAAEALTYLGRPWRQFAQVTFLDTEMSEAVRPEGWHNWDKPDREATVRYAEAGSTGPGGPTDRRVSWAKRLTPAEVKAVTVTAVLGGTDHWSPASVPAHPSTVRALDAPLPSPPGRQQ
jgi:pectinesterase